MSSLRTNNIANVAGTASTDVLNVINGSAKAWVNFNGTGTVAIRQGYNVSSITDNGVGNYTVNFTNAMVDKNFATTVCVSDDDAVAPIWREGGTYTTGRSTLSTKLVVTNNGNSAAFDSTTVSVAIFR